MTLLLQNTGEKSSLTLRYGDGLNKALQLLPGESKPLPSEMTKSLMQSYLSLFKDLKVVKQEEKSDEVVKKSDKEDTITGQDTSNTSEQNNASKNETNGEAGTTQENDNINSQPNEGELNNENQSTEGQSNTFQDSEKEVGGSNGDSDNSDQTPGDSAGQVSEEQYTAKQLKALSADEVKEIAIKLGIDVTAPETNSKKELIAVILNKQENK